MDYTIIPTELCHAEQIAELRRMPSVMENILGLPSERGIKFEEILKQNNPQFHQFVAVVDEIVIGHVFLSLEQNLRRRHVGAIGLMVHADYQNKGVGSKLFQTVLDLADNWLMLKRIELSVYADNRNAIALYEKHGFVIEGKMIGASIRNGVYADEYFMARISD